MDVNHGDEVAAAVEPGEERLAPSQREPAHTKADTESPTAAEEAYECRTIDRRTKERSGAPTPSASDICPAAIVVGSKTPRLITHPTPAPGLDPVPVTVAVRGPVGANTAGIPDMPVLGLVSPSAMVIQVVIPGHVSRNIISRSRAILFQLALLRPTIESVGTRSANDAVGGIFCAVKFRLVAGMHFVCFSIRAYLPVTANHSNA